MAIQYFVEYLLFVFIASPLFLCGSPQKNVGAPFVIRIQNKTFLRPQTEYHWINQPLQRSIINAKFIFHSFYFKSDIKDGIRFSLFDA
ncbi:hypothetical protein DKN74_18875 [Salmonella enterica]|uniref:Uncharacterized protein n=9 Tax=Enterobacteriaceae TaxID=543 RepID=A0A0B1N1F8_ECOLX|nr:hypothetical protein APS44_23940 [Salmonella enterica subsp. enterica serovar Heidelberg]AMN65951.1 hypothetical protein AD871_26515 [Shigella flexneri 4c]AMU85462.1 hypothetical protein Y979_25425 [Escherichia coli str. Sanji]APO16231.1 hypothetical protein [Escherichia coli]APW08581.1 hypothetical protein SEES3845_026070 [Salmonella enterica subsp. enterica serovar Senftenberg str. ATCC 43845]APX31325.1 hypothetical protein BFF41_25325 [Salmonella enterica subsp. enterica serovar Senftenb